MSRLALAFLVSFTTVAAAAGFAKPPPPVEDAPAALQHHVELPSRDDVRAALIAARAKNLAAFRAYVKLGSFPSNTHVDGLANVWRDDEDHFCAAATIMKSGNQALALKIAEENNSLRLADVEEGEVMSWILTSGFTQDELALIQRPFSPVVEKPEPAPILVEVDPDLRRAETARLRKLYAAIDKQLVAKQKQSIEVAVDRLMKNPSVAARFARRS